MDVLFDLFNDARRHAWKTATGLWIVVLVVSALAAVAGQGSLDDGSIRSPIQNHWKAESTAPEAADFRA